MRGNRLLVGFLLLVVAVFLNLPLPMALRMRLAAQNGAAPTHTLLGVMIGRVYQGWIYLTRAGESVRRQEALLDANARLRYRLAVLGAVEEENVELRRLLNFREQRSDRLLLGRVISRGGATGWWRTVRLNRGTLHGVAVDQPVVTADGLIGRVSLAAETTCDVLLITDPTHRAACRVADTPVLGLVQGRGATISGRRDLDMLCAPEPLVVDYIQKHATIAPGSAVETSGLGGVYPPGLRVGTVLRDELDATGLYRRLTLRPAADLSRLVHVWVVLP